MNEQIKNSQLNDPNSLYWRPVNEVCGVDAWACPSPLIPPINGRTRKSYRRDVEGYAEDPIKDYEDRRVFEDGMGRVKLAARQAKLKNGHDVIEVAESLVRTGEPVKMRAAYEILEWFIEGVVDNEF